MVQRTLVQKTEDIKTTYEQFREWITPQEQRDLLADMTSAEVRALIAASGDPNGYAALVQSSITVARLVAENDRAALMAAVQANAGSPARQQEE